MRFIASQTRNYRALGYKGQSSATGSSGCSPTRILNAYFDCVGIAICDLVLCGLISTGPIEISLGQNWTATSIWHSKATFLCALLVNGAPSFTMVNGNPTPPSRIIDNLNMPTKKGNFISRKVNESIEIPLRIDNATLSATLVTLGGEHNVRKSVQTGSSDLRDNFDNLDDELSTEEDMVLKDLSSRQVLHLEGSTSDGQNNKDKFVILYNTVMAHNVAQQNLDLVALNYAVSEIKDLNAWTIVKRKPSQPTKLEQAKRRQDQPTAGSIKPTTRATKYDVRILLSEEQIISVDIPRVGGRQVLSFVYGSVFPGHRKKAWADLKNFANSIDHLWAVIRDFNVILGAHERSGGGPPIFFSYFDFRVVVEAACLLPINTHGAFFTWDRRGTRGYVQSKFDRSFCNDSYLKEFRGCRCLAPSIIPMVCLPATWLKFQVSHIFKEENIVTDALSKIVVSSSEVQWWWGLLDSYTSMYYENVNGFENYRFRK
ncbi:hypothetical protein FNV43_RR04453 [Rhamnella rubrinervis]|uniref:RNase H type-1 domain-containing protein n=1 Tax=Rhamnella rubrinervis TaxID=2594499 RepID=A0A8K0MQL7_9ROSA|nr:hypothetical protein FNV43_RR04453 [Rhamnella rubrinervis]